MDTFKEKNYSVLEKKHPLIFKKVKDCSVDESIEIVQSKNGNPVPSIDYEGKKLFIHSRFDPIKEAERFISGIDPVEHDLYFIFGFGFAYHVEHLLRGLRDDAVLFVIEKSISIIKKSLESRELTEILNDPRLVLLVDPGEDKISENLKGKSSRKVSFITHRGSHQVYSQYYSNILEIVRSTLSKKDVNIATLTKFEKVWSSNLARNIKQFIQYPGVNNFYGRFKNVPAIVVSAGPSLVKSLEFIRQNRGKSIIIAVDTAYKTLLRNGIEPHFCISVDPQLINARYFEGSKPGKTIIITDPTIHPSVFRLFKGRAVTSGIAFDIMKWIERLTFEKGEITHGGSVSTNGYDIAKRLGASPVIMLGQDLAFTWGHAHVRGSYLDEQVHLKTNRLYNSYMFNRYQLTALPKIYVNGIKSDKVHTNQKMIIFLSWFEKRNDKDLINLTYDGAFIPNVEHKEDAGYFLDDLEIDVTSMIDEIYNSSSRQMSGTAAMSQRMIKRINLMLDEIESLVPQLEKAVTFSDNLLELMKSYNRDQGKLDYILKKLSNIDLVIENKKNIKDMISLTIQKVIHTLNEGYDIDTDDGDLTEDELVARKSGYLYQGLLEGAGFNRKILNKMKAILND